MKNSYQKINIKRGLSPHKWALACQCLNLKVSVLLLCMAIFGPIRISAQSPLEVNGRLSVSGTKLVNESGTPVQLRGMSSQGIQWYTEDYNFNSLSLLVNNWGIDVFRMALAPSLKKDSYATTLGYDGNTGFWKGYIDTLVDMCGSLGIYCIIDWHVLAPVPDPTDPTTLPLAKEFFGYMSGKHAGKKQVIYEICNEPSGVTWATVKSYAEQIIPIIRANDPNAVIIVGDPSYSSDLASVAADRLTGDNAKNVMYAFHFYAASHKQDYRDKVTAALNAGLPVFVSEWGTTTYSGDGTIDYPETRTWLDFMKANNISWCNWNYSDKKEASAALQPGVGAFYGGANSWNSTTAEGDSIKKYLSIPADAWNSSGNWKPAVNVYIPDDGYWDFELPTGYCLTNNRMFLGATGISNQNFINSTGFFENINSIEFFVDGVSIGNGYPTNLITLSGMPFRIEWIPTTAKDYVITAVATDSLGAKSNVSLPMIVHVVDALPAETPYPDPNTPATIPGTITLSNFDNGGEMVAYHDLDALHKGPAAGSDRQNEGVDVEGKGATADIGYTISGEWMNYTVNVQNSGLYTLTLTTASALPIDGVFHIESNGNYITKYVHVPTTGDWSKKGTTVVNNIPLSAGVQILKFRTDVGNFNYFTAKFEYTGGTVHTVTTSKTGDGTVVPALSGELLPCGTFTFADGDTVFIMSWANMADTIAEIEVDGNSIDLSSTSGVVTFLKIAANHTVHTTFKKRQSVSLDIITLNSDGTYKVEASSSSGLPVTITSSDPSIASINGDQITLKKPGPFTITAFQAGDSIYASSDLSKTTKIKTLTVTSISATAGTGGSISPSNTLLLLEGSSKTYTITPSTNYKISDVIVDGVSQGPVTSYTFSNLTAATHTISATFTSQCSLAKLFGVPRSTALPTFTATFMHAYVIGTGGPNLTTVNTLAINWDLANKGLYNCAFNFNASPWYLNLIPITTNTFASASPSCTIKGSGITGLDGSYYANWDGTHFILVSKTGNFAIYGSNATTPPAGCGTTKSVLAATDGETNGEGTFIMFPNPVDRNSQVSINLSNVSADGAIITITDLNGKVLYNDILRSTTNRLDFGGKLNSGLYIVKVINGNEQYNGKLIVK